MGAWIEIRRCKNMILTRDVAPLVGAWIEIYLNRIYSYIKLKSLPSWERGLKLMD